MAAGQSDMVLPDGEVLHGTGRRHIEYPIHTEILAPGRRGRATGMMSGAGNFIAAFSFLITVFGVGCLAGLFLHRSKYLQAQRVRGP
jgi:hypothetical protein